MAAHSARRKAHFPGRGITRFRQIRQRIHGIVSRGLRPETERERERREFFARENAAYERLRANPAQWNAMLSECEAFDPASVHPSDWQ
jgi:hypothetical protein